MNPLRWIGNRLVGEQLRALQGRTIAAEATVADLRNYIYQTGYFGINVAEVEKIDRDLLARMVPHLRVAALESPLIVRGVMVYALYTFAKGFSFELAEEDATAQRRLEEITGDAKNRASLLSPDAMDEADRELLATGHLFAMLQSESSNGSNLSVPSARLIPFEQIQEIIYDPQDHTRPLYFRRTLPKRTFDPESGRKLTDSGQKVEWLPHVDLALDNRNDRLDRIDGNPIVWERPVEMMRTGGYPGWPWGYPIIRAAVDWAKRHTDFLSDSYEFSQARAKYAQWINKTVGADSDALDALQTVFNANYDSGGDNSNEPPVAGSTLITGGGIEFQKLSAATGINMDDRRASELQVARAFGLPEILFGDLGESNLATAKAMEKPTELLFQNRQRDYGNFLSSVVSAMLAMSMSSNITREGQGRPEVKVEWPPFADLDLMGELERRQKVTRDNAGQLTPTFAADPRLALDYELGPHEPRKDEIMSALDDAAAFVPQSPPVPGSEPAPSQRRRAS